MDEKYIKAWRDFVDGNQELLINHTELITLAFRAGWQAAEEKLRSFKGREAATKKRR